MQENSTVYIVVHNTVYIYIYTANVGEAMS